MAYWPCPNFYPGQLGVLRHFYQKDERFEDGIFNYIQGELTDIYITDELIKSTEQGSDSVLALKGEDGVSAPYPNWIGYEKPSYTASEVEAIALSKSISNNDCNNVFRNHYLGYYWDLANKPSGTSQTGILLSISNANSISSADFAAQVYWDLANKPSGTSQTGILLSISNANSISSADFAAQVYWDTIHFKLYTRVAHYGVWKDWQSISTSIH